MYWYVFHMSAYMSVCMHVCVLRKIISSSFWCNANSWNAMQYRHTNVKTNPYYWYCSAKEEQLGWERYNLLIFCWLVFTHKSFHSCSWRIYPRCGPHRWRLCYCIHLCWVADSAFVASEWTRWFVNSSFESFTSFTLLSFSLFPIP